MIDSLENHTVKKNQKHSFTHQNTFHQKNNIVLNSLENKACEIQVDVFIGPLFEHASVHMAFCYIQRFFLQFLEILIEYFWGFFKFGENVISSLHSGNFKEMNKEEMPLFSIGKEKNC